MLKIEPFPSFQDDEDNYDGAFFNKKLKSQSLVEVASDHNLHSMRESEKIEDPFYFYQKRKNIELEIGHKVVLYARPVNLKTKFKASTAFKFRKVFLQN